MHGYLPNRRASPPIGKRHKDNIKTRMVDKDSFICRSHPSGRLPSVAGPSQSASVPTNNVTSALSSAFVSVRKTSCSHSLSHGTVISWVDEMRYLGIFIVRSRTFKCSLEHAKKSFYRAANAVFAKVGRVASEEVTLQLIKVKCLPVLWS